MTKKIFHFLLAASLYAAPSLAEDEEKPVPSPLDEAIKQAQLDKLEADIAEQKRATEAAARKEIVDSLPAGSTTGAIGVKDGAAQAEAFALAAKALTPVAANIAAEARTALDLAARRAPDGANAAQACDALPQLNFAPTPTPTPTPAPTPATGAAQSVPPLLLVGGADTVGFSHWDAFHFRACKIAGDYTAAQAANASAIEDAEDYLKSPGVNKAVIESIIGAVQLVSAAVKLAQLATPDWEVAPIALNVSDRLLLVQVANAYLARSGHGPLYWQTAVGGRGGSETIFAALTALDEKNKPVETGVDTLGKAIKAGEEALKKPTPPAGLKERVKKWTDASEALGKPIAAHVQLVKDLYGGDATSPLPFSLVANEAASARLLGSNGLVLSLKMENSGGTSASRKAIWNIFETASPPLYVSGTVVVSYAVLSPADQSIQAAGSFSCSTGMVRLSKVRNAVATASGFACSDPVPDPVRRPPDRPGPR